MKMQNKNSRKMVLVFLLLSFFVSVSSAKAGMALLEWDANSESDLAGYKIYYGTSPRSDSSAPGGYSNGPIEFPGSKTQYMLRSLQNGQKIYFSVTAYDTSGNESTFSNEVSKDIIQDLSSDLNLDRVVNLFDYNVFVSNFGQLGCGNLADIDGNCGVNLFDYNLFVADFGKSY